MLHLETRNELGGERKEKVPVVEVCGLISAPPSKRCRRENFRHFGRAILRLSRHSGLTPEIDEPRWLLPRWVDWYALVGNHSRVAQMQIFECPITLLACFR